MKTRLIVTIVSIMTATAFAGTPASQSIVFDDLGLGGGTANSGTYNSNDTFSFDVVLSFSGYNASGLDFWLETDPVFGGSLSITGTTYGTTFPNHNNATFPIFFGPGGGEDFDLGSSAPAVG